MKEFLKLMWHLYREHRFAKRAAAELRRQAHRSTCAFYLAGQALTRLVRRIRK